MDTETPLCDAPEAPEATPRAGAGRRPAFAHPALRAARVRPVAGLEKLTRRRRAANAGVMPTVRYRDVPAAIAWLTAAFGMQVHRSVAGEDGRARYAELEFGGNLLMIAPIEDTPFGKLMVQPDEVGGVETQICYLHVDDVAIHYARARAAGAEIVLDIEDEANSGRGYSCRDPEGHLWNLGSYHPWRKPGAAPPDRAGPAGSGADRRRDRSGLSVLLLLLLGALLVSWAAPRLPDARADTARIETPTPEAAPPDQEKREAGVPKAGDPEAPKTPKEGPERKERKERRAGVDKAALAAAEKRAEAARTELAEAQAALKKAERETRLAKAEAEETRHARLAAEQAADKTRASLAAAQKDAEAARAEAAAERSRRIAAEQAADRPRRRVAGYRRSIRRGPVWCYSPHVPNPSRGRSGRLVGFCKE
jgi:uncharacterized glyoxalase superfamily protein PhnB